MVKLNSCHSNSNVGRQKRNRRGYGHETQLTFALAGNTNVGKSVIFNRLTGSHQIIGNWPGKTVERAEGFLSCDGYNAVVVDLPGIYSLSTFSLEEIVSREYIAEEKPDVIINVVSAAVLERNLFFTLQLLELGVPLVICLNQVDIARQKGITVNGEKLAQELGVPVISTVAKTGEGVPELIETAVKAAKEKKELWNEVLAFDSTIEENVDELTHAVNDAETKLPYPDRWTAVKLLEGDDKITGTVASLAPGLIKKARTLAGNIEEHYDQPSFAAITADRYATAARIADEAQQQEPVRQAFAERLERITTHRIYGYIIAFSVIAFLLLWTLLIGNSLSNLLTGAFNFFQPVNPQVRGSLLSVVWNGLFGGLVAGVTLVIPYVVPFYVMLSVMEDSGILTRVAFMMDSAMHRMGLHGKAIIPLILGFGCNVPAIYATRIMGSRRERLLAAFAVTFTPCTARTIIILGMVGAFLGFQWALAIYVADLIIMFAVTRLAVNTVPGELTGLIMEMHAFKMPTFSIVAKQTWARTKSLVYMVFPMYMVTSAAVQLAYAAGWLGPVDSGLSWLTVSWLGLPLIAGTLLIFGAARKELILLMAVVLFGHNLINVMSPSQIIVLALVGTIYPCFATIGTLTREFGWKAAWSIIGANVATALLVGGITAKVLAVLKV